MKHVTSMVEEIVRISSHDDNDEEKEKLASMDNRIWSLLPQELQDTLIAGLPIVSIFRMRAVCKRFQSIVLSPSFLSSWSALAAQEHWLLMFHRQDSSPWMSMAAYDSNVKQWYNLPVLRPFFSKQGNVSLASSQGLLCIAPVEDSHTLIVWNPLTNVFKALPGMSIKNTMCVGLVVDVRTKEFTIVVVGQTEDALQTTEVYSSSTTVSNSSWKRMDTSLIEWYGCYSDPLVYCNGCFHVISAHKNGPFRFVPLPLFSYDQEFCAVKFFFRFTFAVPIPAPFIQSGKNSLFGLKYVQTHA